jgi:hypothetical protein
MCGGIALSDCYLRHWFEHNKRFRAWCLRKRLTILANPDRDRKKVPWRLEHVKPGLGTSLLCPGSFLHSYTHDTGFLPGWIDQPRCSYAGEVPKGAPVAETHEGRASLPLTDCTIPKLVNSVKAKARPNLV